MSFAISADHPSETVTLCERLAPRYDNLHRRWLAHGGGEAQAALEASVRAVMGSKERLLDVGCGTGALARRLVREGMDASQITLLDPSEEMLALCDDIPARKVNGRLESLPFDDGAFDIVACAWALETASDLLKAIAELSRVTRSGGALCLVFCDDVTATSPVTWLMRWAMKRRGLGKLLSPEHVRSILWRNHQFDVRIVPTNGLGTALIARKS